MLHRSIPSLLSRSLAIYSGRVYWRYSSAQVTQASWLTLLFYGAGECFITPFQDSCFLPLVEYTLIFAHPFMHNNWLM